jgi:hypothetical protein
MAAKRIPLVLSIYGLQNGGHTAQCPHEAGFLGTMQPEDRRRARAGGQQRPSPRERSEELGHGAKMGRYNQASRHALKKEDGKASLKTLQRSPGGANWSGHPQGVATLDTAA